MADTQAHHAAGDLEGSAHEPERSVSDDSARLLNQIRAKSDELKAAFEEASVARAYLFGSVARGTANPASDIDIYVEYLPEISDVDAFLTTGALIDTLTDILGTRVDVLAKVLAKPAVLENARREMIAFPWGG